jgi:hypothetical protein
MYKRADIWDPICSSAACARDAFPAPIGPDDFPLDHAVVGVANDQLTRPSTRSAAACDQPGVLECRAEDMLAALREHHLPGAPSIRINRNYGWRLDFHSPSIDHIDTDGIRAIPQP